MDKNRMISILMILNEEEKLKKGEEINKIIREYKDCFPHDFKDVKISSLNKYDSHAMDSTELSCLAFELKKILLVDNKNYQMAIGLIWFWETWMGNLYELKERIEKLEQWWEDKLVYEDGLGWGWGEIYKWWANNFNPERVIVAYMLSKEL